MIRCSETCLINVKLQSAAGFLGKDSSLNHRDTSKNEKNTTLPFAILYYKYKVSKKEANKAQRLG